MVCGGYEIERWKMPEYFTPEIIKALDLYFDIKRYGWPHNTAWAKNPANIVRLVKALDAEANKRNANRQS